MTRLRYGWTGALVALGVLALPGLSFAQQEDADPRKAAFYRFVEPGQATMRINVWGDVDAPGRYEIRAGTDLLDLLFLAGGTSSEIERSNEKRETTVQLTRKTGETWSVVFTASLADVAEGRQPYPALQEGDTMKISTLVKRTFSWRDLFTVVGSVGTVVLVIERITRLSN